MLIPRIKVFTNPVTLKPCSEAGWDRAVELADPKIRIITTKGVSASAINAVANIYTEMMNRLLPTPAAPQPKRKFDGFRVYITNNESWDVQSKLPVVGTMFPDKTGVKSGRYIQGGAQPNYLWITEQMIAKEGVKNRNIYGDGMPDHIFRTFDQVVHEMAHSIDFQLVDDRVIEKFTEGTPSSIENFAHRVQGWFFVPVLGISPVEEAELKKIFSSRAAFSIEGYKP